MLLCLMAMPALAQSLDVAHWRSGLATVTHGWREQTGDNLVWAQPGFDDRGWQAVDLDDLGAAEPGWHWYRLHLILPPEHSHLHLLIAGGEGIYTLYVNGKEAEGAALRPWFAVSRPTEQLISLEGEGSDLEIALRTYTPQIYAAWHLPLFLTAALGTPAAIENEQATLESQRLYSTFPSIAINPVLILAGIAAFALYGSQRRHREYLWLGLYLFLLGWSNLLQFCSANGLVSLAWNSLAGDPLIYFVTIMQIEFTFSFTGQRVGRAWRVYEVLLGVPLILAGLVACGRFSSGLYVLVEAATILPAALLLPVLLLLWYRSGKTEAGWLILPSLLPAATTALYDVGSASLYTGWGRADFLVNPLQLGPVPLQLADLGDLLFVLAIGVVMFFRFARVSREQARATAELEAARALQQRLVPAQLPQVRGYRMEAAYLPAEEVGGDFYQVLRVDDSSTLVIVGDVSGKGLQAAMTGTLALGALRTLAATGTRPGHLLQRLNEQIVVTQEAGFITCLCVWVDAEGHMLIANAGHLPPYRNGKEVALDSGLPLGIAADAEYVEQAFLLAPGDLLTLVSDGVVEARNAGGELFGFGRTQEISRQPAEQIAQVARGFGQSDDITVLTMRRMAVQTGSAEDGLRSAVAPA